MTRNRSNLATQSVILKQPSFYPCQSILLEPYGKPGDSFLAKFIKVHLLRISPE